MRAALTAMAMAALSSCAEQSDAERERAQMQAAFEARAMTAWQTVEPDALARAGDAAERRDRLLILRPSAGEEIRLESNGDCRGNPNPDSQCYDYVLLAYAPSLGVFLVRQLFYEGSLHFVIDMRTGNQTALPGFPHFSPDGEEAILSAGFYDEPQTLQIWSRDGGAFTPVWEGNPTFGRDTWDTKYTVIEWIGPDRVQLRADLVLAGVSFETVQLPFELRRSRDEWVAVVTGG